MHKAEAQEDKLIAGLCPGASGLKQGEGAEKDREGGREVL